MNSHIWIMDGAVLTPYELLVVTRWPSKEHGKLALVLAVKKLHSMIRIKSYIVIAFSYRKANKLRKWSEILHFCYGNKGLCHGCRSQ